MVCPPGQCPGPAAGHAPVPSAQGGPGRTSRPEALAVAKEAATAAGPAQERDVSWLGPAAVGAGRSRVIEELRW
jgi:hypothetical protein